MASMVLLSLRILESWLDIRVRPYPGNRIRATSTGGISLKFAPQER